VYATMSRQISAKPWRSEWPERLQSSRIAGSLRPVSPGWPKFKNGPIELPRGFYELNVSDKLRNPRHDPSVGLVGRTIDFDAFTVAFKRRKCPHEQVEQFLDVMLQRLLSPGKCWSIIPHTNPKPCWITSISMSGISR